jgi:hypothetical protein
VEKRIYEIDEFYYKSIYPVVGNYSNPIFKRLVHEHDEIIQKYLTENEENENCSICLENIRIVSSIPECDHKFHPECLEEWKREHNDCPNCRGLLGELLEEYADYEKTKPDIMNHIVRIQTENLSNRMYEILGHNLFYNEFGTKDLFKWYQEKVQKIDKRFVDDGNNLSLLGNNYFFMSTLRQKYKKALEKKFVKEEEERREQLLLALQKKEKELKEAQEYRDYLDRVEKEQREWREQNRKVELLKRQQRLQAWEEEKKEQLLAKQKRELSNNKKTFLPFPLFFPYEVKSMERSDKCAKRNILPFSLGTLNDGVPIFYTLISLFLKPVN